MRKYELADKLARRLGLEDDRVISFDSLVESTDDIKLIENIYNEILAEEEEE